MMGALYELVQASWASLSMALMAKSIVLVISPVKETKA